MISPVRRWKRLMSPHGVFQVPKSACNLSDAAASDCKQLFRRPLLRDVILRRHAPPPAAHRRHADGALRRPRTLPAKWGRIATPQRRSHPRKDSICSAVFAFSGFDGGVRVPCLDQRGHRLLEPGEIAVVRRGDQRVDREILLVLQNADRVQAARGFAALLDVSGKIFLLGAARPRGRPRPVVASCRASRWPDSAGAAFHRC